MSERNPRKVGLGLALFAVGSVLFLGAEAGVFRSLLTVVLVALVTLGLAAGALLAGASEPGRPA